jgi:putative transport protein
MPLTFDGLAEAFRRNPELAFFLALALGFLLGRVRVGKFTLGPVLGTLLAGVVIGQTGVTVPPVVKTIFFDLFLFATGFKVGPQFFRGLKKDALPQLALTAVICVTSLLTAIGLARLLGYDVGTAAGLLAGAFSESTVIGTASEAIQRLALPASEKARLVNNIPVAYAVTYLVGTTSVVWFLSSLAPRLLRIDLREESRRVERSLSGPEEGRSAQFPREWDIRAFRVENPAWAGLTVEQIERSVPGARIFVERLRQSGKSVEPDPGTVVGIGDTIAIAGRRSELIQRMSEIGPEVTDEEVLDFPILVLDTVVTRKEAGGMALEALARLHGRGVVLRRLVRSGQELPFAPGTVVNRGDQLQIVGREGDVERVGRALGYLDRPSPATDVVFLGLGIVLGGLVGLLSLTVSGISITLTTSGGALVMGLAFGWLRSTRPTFGRIPEAALWVFDNVGLAGFIGAVGLAAGPGFVAGVRQTGLGLLGAGLVAAIVPQAVGLLVGRLLLKMDPVILLGACTGAGTSTAALKAVQDAAGSKVPVLGYTVPYAVGNILLTAWGPVIVALMR